MRILEDFFDDIEEIELTDNISNDDVQNDQNDTYNYVFCFYIMQTVNDELYNKILRYIDRVKYIWSNVSGLNISDIIWNFRIVGGGVYKSDEYFETVKNGDNIVLNFFFGLSGEMRLSEVKSVINAFKKIDIIGDFKNNFTLFHNCYNQLKNVIDEILSGRMSYNYVPMNDLKSIYQCLCGKKYRNLSNINCENFLKYKTNGEPKQVFLGSGSIDFKKLIREDKFVKCRLYGDYNNNTLFGNYIGDGKVWNGELKKTFKNQNYSVDIVSWIVDGAKNVDVYVSTTDLYYNGDCAVVYVIRDTYRSQFMLDEHNVIYDDEFVCISFDIKNCFDKQEANNALQIANESGIEIDYTKFIVALRQI